MKRYLATVGSLIGPLCLIASAAIADTPIAFRTDADLDDKLPWFQLVKGEFPPAGSAHYFAGELTKVDHLERSFVLRVDRTDRQNRSHFDLPVAAKMLPFGSIYYHGAPASLADIPLGTHLHGLFYVKDPSDETKPLEIFHNRRSYEVDFNRCFRIEDDFSFRERQSQLWQVDEVNAEGKKLSVTLIEDGKAIGSPQSFDLTTTTRIWRGRSLASLDSLTPQEQIQFNITWATLYGPGRILEIWADEDSRKAASAYQKEKHQLYIRERGIPGWIDAVDNQERILTITFFAGVDWDLFGDVLEGDQAGVAVATESLLMFDPVNDRKRGPILNVMQVPVQPGSSGVQIQVKPDLLLEGFRPQRIVRVYPSRWPVVALPREEELFGR
ncbi:MAG: hypothetical protein KDB11_19660 [Planctomycetales bacterium]|nr:hypothetical protein [Planctomycetales bacterium]